MTNRTRPSRAAALLLPAAALGCAQTTYRQVTAEHWHDENTVLIAYSEVTRQNYVVYSTVESTAHVLVCRVARDNSVTCHAQPVVDRLLAGAPPGPAPITPTPTATVPSATVPSATVPSAAVPSATVPSAAVPSAAVPSAAVPSAAVPSSPMDSDASSASEGRREVEPTR